MNWSPLIWSVLNTNSSFFFKNSGRGYAKPLTLTVHISFKTGFLQPTLNYISHFPLLLYLLTIENTWTGAKSRHSCAQFLFFIFYLSSTYQPPT